MFFFSFVFFSFYSYNGKQSNASINAQTQSSIQNQINSCRTNYAHVPAGDNQDQIIVFNILREMLNNQSMDHNRNQFEISYDSIIIDPNFRSVEDLPSYENAIKKQINL